MNGKKKLICPSCGAEFPADIPNCPYCGRMNAPAAETEYMQHMENIRADLEKLGERTGQESRKHVRSLKKKLAVAVLILALAVAVGFGTSQNRRKAEAEKEKAEYLWQREAFAEMDEYYAAGDYAGLAALYAEASDAGHRPYRYRHSGFCEYLLEVQGTARALEEYERWGGAPSSLFYREISLYALEYTERINDEERQVLEQMRAPLLKDFEERFHLSEDEMAPFLKMLKEQGYIPYAECERFLKEKGMLE